MKLTKKTCIILASALLSAGIAVTSIITATEYSAEDPLISKSWVDNIFYPQIVQYVDAKIEEVKALISPANTADVTVQDGSVVQNTEIPQSTDTGAQTASEQNLSYEVVTLTSGQMLTSTDGSLEIILRPGGTASVYSEIAGNGIADLTSGTELLGGTEIPINSYCLVPRGDGRGIVCTSETAYVMVRGKYEIK